MKKIVYICDCCNKEMTPSEMSIKFISKEGYIHTFSGGISGVFDVCPSCLDKIYNLHFKKEDKNDNN